MKLEITVTPPTYLKNFSHSFSDSHCVSFNHLILLIQCHIPASGCVAPPLLIKDVCVSETRELQREHFF